MDSRKSRLLTWTRIKERAVHFNVRNQFCGFIITCCLRKNSISTDAIEASDVSAKTEKLIKQIVQNLSET